MAGTVAVLAVAAGAITAADILVSCRRGAKPIPSMPRGVNDECR